MNKEIIYFRLADGVWRGAKGSCDALYKLQNNARFFGVSTIIVDEHKADYFPNVKWNDVEIVELKEDEPEEDEDEDDSYNGFYETRDETGKKVMVRRC